MTVLLLKVSGVSLLEKDIAERRPAYRDYVARTPAFFPGPPRRAPLTPRLPRRHMDIACSEAARRSPSPPASPPRCWSPAPARRAPRWQPLALAADVDLARFMGDWYVIAAIPTVFERDAHNPIDTLSRSTPDGSVATTFSFNAGAFDGPRKRYGSRGFVVAGHGQRGLGPAVHLADPGRLPASPTSRADYVAGRRRRARSATTSGSWRGTPTIAAADLDRLTAFVAAQGYDTSRLRRMPQAGGRLIPKSILMNVKQFADRLRRRPRSSSSPSTRSG